MTETPYIGIDLFAGVGGLSYGLSQAGFDMRMGIEIDSTAAFNLKMNNKNTEVITSDITTLDPMEVMNGRTIKKDDIDIIVGGPPCQGFSQSNRRTRDSNNPANSLYFHFFRFIKAIKPRLFLLENVAGLKTINNGQILNDILRISSSAL